MWTVNFQIFKLDLKKAEEPEITLPTPFGSSKKQESSKKTSTSALLTMPKALTVWITTNCGKFFKDGNTRPPDLPPEKYVCKSRSNRTRYGTMDWFKTGKGVCQGCVLSPCLSNLHAEYIMQNARLDESQARIKIAGENINNLRDTDDTTVMAEGKEELRSLLMKVKEWKSWLKTQH